MKNSALFERSEFDEFSLARKIADFPGNRNKGEVAHPGIMAMFYEDTLNAMHAGKSVG